MLYIAKTSSGANSGSAVTHLDAVLEDVSRERETFLPVDWLAEDYQLLEKEDPSFLCSGEEAAVLLCDGEGVLLEQFALGRDLPLHRGGDKRNTQSKWLRCGLHGPNRRHDKKTAKDDQSS